MVHDSADWRALTDNADKTLHAAVEKMRIRFRLHPPTETIVAQIKEAMDAILADGRSVKLHLCLNWRNQVFNNPDRPYAPAIQKQFNEAIAQYLAGDGKKASKKQAERFAANLWKIDNAANRRIKGLASHRIEKWKSPYRGAPEKYDSEVVRLFMDAIVAASGKKTFECGNRDKPGIMMNVLLSMITWAMTSTWLCAPACVSPPSKTKFEGLLPIVRGIKKLAGN